MNRRRFAKELMISLSAAAKNIEHDTRLQTLTEVKKEVDALHQLIEQLKENGKVDEEQYGSYNHLIERLEERIGEKEKKIFSK